MDNWNEIDILEQALSEAVTDYDVTPLTLGESGAFLARVSGKTKSGNMFSVVIKSRMGKTAHAALWYCPDPGLLDREIHVYDLLKRLDLPHAHVLAQIYTDSSHWTIVLEDLAEQYRLLDRNYEFTTADRQAIIDTYALIHSRTMNLYDPIMDHLQPEEGSQVDASTADEMLETFASFEIESHRMNPDEFRESTDILFHLREKWRSEPRCLAFNDFYQTNVALPQEEPGYAVLFDWELAGCSLPQFDALNAGFAEGDELIYYIERMKALGMEIDSDKFKSGLHYARLCGSFYTLWLLHLKLKADPSGRLPSWMRSGAIDSLSGGLIKQARNAIILSCHI